MPPPISLFSITAILLLSTDDSSRLLARYYAPPHMQTSGTNPSQPAQSQSSNPYPTQKEQKTFEKGLLEKTSKQSSDVILYDNRVVVFKVESDVMMYVVGDAGENEVLLYSALLALRDSLSILLKNSTDKRTIIENYDLVSLAVDEICDDGILLETDPVVIASRVSKPPAQDMTSMKGIDLSEQGLLNAWELGKAKLAERLKQSM